MRRNLLISTRVILEQYWLTRQSHYYYVTSTVYILHIDANIFRGHFTIWGGWVDRGGVRPNHCNENARETRENLKQCRIHSVPIPEFTFHNIKLFIALWWRQGYSASVFVFPCNNFFLITAFPFSTDPVCIGHCSASIDLGCILMHEM